jgi:hypothetical protein
VTTVASTDGPVGDNQLVAMLRAIGDHDSDDELDNRALSRSLGWTADKTAASLGEARSRLLIWGIRVGGAPGPCFEDIVLTVQGRRFAAAADG